MGSYEKGKAFLRQLGTGGGEDCRYDWCYQCGSAKAAKKKRVMAVIDHANGSKFAVMWALTHVADRGDLLTILHVVPAAGRGSPPLANSLVALCRSCKPEVKVEALVVQGPKLATVVNQVRKLQASVLVLSQGKQSPFRCNLMRRSSENFVEDCINHADCLTLAVRNKKEELVATWSARGGGRISGFWLDLL